MIDRVIWLNMMLSLNDRVWMAMTVYDRYSDMIEYMYDVEHVRQSMDCNAVVMTAPSHDLICRLDHMSLK